MASVWLDGKRLMLPTGLIVRARSFRMVELTLSVERGELVKRRNGRVAKRSWSMRLKQFLRGLVGDVVMVEMIAEETRRLIWSAMIPVDIEVTKKDNKTVAVIRGRGSTRTVERLPARFVLNGEKVVGVIYMVDGSIVRVESKPIRKRLTKVT